MYFQRNWIVTMIWIIYNFYSLYQILYLVLPMITFFILDPNDQIKEHKICPFSICHTHPSPDSNHPPPSNPNHSTGFLHCWGPFYGVVCQSAMEPWPLHTADHSSAVWGDYSSHLSNQVTGWRRRQEEPARGISPIGTPPQKKDPRGLRSPVSGPDGWLGGV